MKCLVTLGASLVVEYPVCDLPSPGMPAAALPPDNSTGPPVNHVRSQVSVQHRIPFPAQLRIRCLQIVETRLYLPAFTDRAPAAVCSGVNNRLPFMAAFPASPPDIPPGQRIQGVRHQTVVSLRPFLCQFRICRSQIVEARQEADAAAVGTSAAAGANGNQSLPFISAT